MPTVTLPKRNGATIVGAGVLAAEQKKQISDYIRARRLQAEATALIEKLKNPVLSIVAIAGGKVAMMDAIVRISQSVTYDYPPTLMHEEDKLRKLKKIMQLDGRAQKIEKPCLQFSEVGQAACL